MSEAEAPAEKEAASGRARRPDPLIGRVINDRFRIVSLIARGGMGKVYRAEQAPLGREVALKVLNPSYQGDHDPEFHKRFFLEASTCSKLTHPNTVTIFDYGRTDDDIYYIAMELLEGKTLHRALREDTRLPAERALHIARQMCRSLREAHSLGVIHRDLKPANIFLMKHGDENDFVKVLDFGLVKDLHKEGEDLTQTGLFMGSPKYMSPEQIRGDDVDARADVYSLGVILYQMLTGKVPFDRPNSVNILMAHVHEAPPTISEMAPDAAIDATIEGIVMRAIAKEPEDRFQNMDEFLVALKHAAAAGGLMVSRSGETAVSGEFAVGAQGITGRYGAIVGSSPPLHRSSSSMPASLASSLSSSMPSAQSMPPIAAATSGQLELDNPNARRRGLAVLFIAASLVLAIGIGSWFALQPEDTEASNPLPPLVDTTTTTTEEPAEEPTQPETTIARVLVDLRSEPPGATVEVGDRSYGPTPLQVEWTGEDAEEGREVTFQFHLDGHRDFTVTRTVIGDSLDVRAELDPIQATPTRMVRRPPRPRMRVPMMSTSTEMDGSPAIGLKGYKAEPY